MLKTIFFAGLLTSAAVAGEPSGKSVDPIAVTRPAGGPSLSVEASGQVEFLEKSAAVPSGLVWHSRLALPLYARLSDRWKLTGGLAGEMTDYEQAPFTDRGLTVWKVGASLFSEHKLSDRWSTTVGGFVSLSFEEGADLGESLAGGALATLGYRWSPTLQTSLGPLFISRANDDPLIVPAIGVEWQPTEALLISLRGLRARAQYKVNEEWDLFWRGEWDPSGVRLKERANTRVTGVSDSSFRTGPGVTWHPAKAWSVSVDGGVAFHQVTLLDNGNNEVRKESLDPAAYVGLSVSARF